MSSGMSSFFPVSPCKRLERNSPRAIPETLSARSVIARQRPGTAKGFVFLSLEDETGISNVIVNPDLYEKYRVVINREKFLRVEGVLQNQDHTISIKACRVLPISITAAETQSHDFH
jgi:error-prone DNA polymerase